MRKIKEEYAEEIKNSTPAQIEKEIIALKEEIAITEEELKEDKAYLDYLCRELHTRRQKESGCKACRYYNKTYSICLYTSNTVPSDTTYACDNFELKR